MTQYRTPDGLIADTAGSEHLSDDELYQIFEHNGVFLCGRDGQPIDLQEMTTADLLDVLGEAGYALARHVGGGQADVPCLEWHILPVRACTVVD